ncbi:MAG: 5-(carboxyamino)imidazole ribonucleotide mutase [Christensenellales bacterium]|jgi:5-(carboxyamino)imidazole ribonucleotide mutase
MSKVAVIMGSKNDLTTVQPALDILKKFEITNEVRVISAHRTPDEARKFASEAISEGIEVIIAAAGKAAHLGGFIAAYTTLPVIGLPVMSSTLDGLDSLLSMVQMPPGVPVACVAINGALNAGLLAVQILALKDERLRKELDNYKKTMRENVINDDITISKEASGK